ncbi:MAG: hypothetical protein D6815_11185, partial [Candidatus Dadabacteria bacterium]
MGRIRWATDLRSRFLPDDPAAAAMELEREQFGDQHAFFLLAESTRSVGARELGEILRSWRQALESIPGIERVWTPYDLPAIAVTAEGSIKVRPVGETPSPLRELWRHPLARGTFLRRDGRGLAVAIVPSPQAVATFAGRKRLVEAVGRWASRQSSPFRLSIAGTLPFEVRCVALARREGGWILTGVCGFSLLLLALAFRSAAAALAVLGVGAVNVGTTFGLAGFFSSGLSQFNYYVAPVVLTVSLLDNVHITHAYARAREFASANTEAARMAVTEMLLPCTLTSATTAAGFLALLSSRLPQVRQFGALAATGTVVALASSLALLPPLLRRFDLKRPSQISSRLGRAVYRLPPGWTTGLAAVALAVAVPGLARLRVVLE